MPKLVVHGATLRCSEGLAPAALTILPTNLTEGDTLPAATVMEHIPMVNIAPFGMCKSAANPQVAAATSAAGGVLTPVPCIPVIAAPWSPGAAATEINGYKALTADSKCSCAWSGSVEIVDPASTVDVE